MAERSSCLICGRYAQVQYSGAHKWIVDCYWCGRYSTEASFPDDLTIDPSGHALLPYLAAHVRQTGDRTSQLVSIGPEWKKDAAAHQHTTLSQKIRMLLEWIAARSRVGVSVDVEADTIAPFIDARDSDESRFLLQHLASLGYIKFGRQVIPTKDRRPSSSGDVAQILLDVAGWEAVSPVAGAGISGVCFVAMSFDPSLNEAFEHGMVPAIQQECGFRVVRIDRVEHNDDINDRILAGIRSAQFLVADFTMQRPGVYFEAGFAAGLGRTVIWCCRTDDFDNLHFDTRQRSHIRWTTPEDLRQQLTARIRATVALPAQLSGRP